MVLTIFNITYYTKAIQTLCYVERIVPNYIKELKPSILKGNPKCDKTCVPCIQSSSCCS